VILNFIIYGILDARGWKNIITGKEFFYRNQGGSITMNSLSVVSRMCFKRYCQVNSVSKEKIAGLIHTPRRVRRVLTILAGQGFGCPILLARITRVAVVALKGCLAAHPWFSKMQKSCFIVDAAALKEYPMGPLLRGFLPRMARPWTLWLPPESRI